MDWGHAIVMGILVGGTYWAVRSMGWLENRSKAQQALIVFPVVFVVALIFNMIWPPG